MLSQAHPWRRLLHMQMVDKRLASMQTCRPRVCHSVTSLVHPLQASSSPTLAFNPDMLPVVPTGTVPLLTLLGHGTQNYTCIANGAQLVATAADSTKTSGGFEVAACMVGFCTCDCP